MNSCRNQHICNINCIVVSLIIDYEYLSVLIYLNYNFLSCHFEKVVPFTLIEIFKDIKSSVFKNYLATRKLL